MKRAVIVALIVLTLLVVSARYVMGEPQAVWLAHTLGL